MSSRHFLHAVAAVGLCAAFGVATVAEAAAPRRPFPRHVAYTDGTIIPNHKTRAQLDDSVEVYYDAWKAAFVRQGCGAGRTYIALDGRPGTPGATTPISVSEGTGLGMLIFPHMAGYDAGAQARFDGLYRFFRDHPSQHDPNLMAWRQLGNCASSSDRNSASDGDLNIAFGLLLAHAQWGSDGPINYRAEALKVLAAIRAHEVHPTTDLIQLGDWVHPAYPLEYEAVRMSDLMPLQFRTFRTFSGDAGWNETMLAGFSLYNRMQQNWAPGTGLVPDFAINTPSLPRPADAGFIGEYRAGKYAYNACRIPWELALDYLLARGANALTITTRMMNWLQTASGGDIYKIYAGYELNGANFEGYNNVCFTGAFGVGAMVDARYQTLLNRIWDDVAISHAGDLTDYYGATLRMVYLLTMSGNFWRP